MRKRGKLLLKSKTMMKPTLASSSFKTKHPAKGRKGRTKRERGPKS
jgi:hypothetical protein